MSINSNDSPAPENPQLHSASLEPSESPRGATLPSEDVPPHELQASLLKLVVKRGRFLFFLVLIMGSVFCFWGLHFFVLNEPTQGVPMATAIVFSVMAFLSFLYGFKFVKNYTKVRRLELIKQDVEKRKEALIVATAIQLLLIEFVCIIGLFLAIFTQIKEVIYPFYFVFIIGLYFSYPKADWYKDIIENNSR